MSGLIRFTGTGGTPPTGENAASSTYPTITSEVYSGAIPALDVLEGSGSVDWEVFGDSPPQKGTIALHNGLVVRFDEKSGDIIPQKWKDFSFRYHEDPVTDAGPSGSTLIGMARLATVISSGGIMLGLGLFGASGLYDPALISAWTGFENANRISGLLCCSVPTYPIAAYGGWKLFDHATLQVLNARNAVVKNRVSARVSEIHRQCLAGETTTVPQHDYYPPFSYYCPDRVPEQEIKWPDALKYSQLGVISKDELYELIEYHVSFVFDLLFDPSSKVRSDRKIIEESLKLLNGIQSLTGSDSSDFYEFLYQFNYVQKERLAILLNGRNYSIVSQLCVYLEALLSGHAIRGSLLPRRTFSDQIRQWLGAARQWLSGMRHETNQVS